MKISRRAIKVEVPNVAMGDIAFNLLIFFFILAKATDDSGLKWKPAAAPKVEHAPHSRVSVLVDTDHKLYLNGRQIGISELSTAVEKLLGDAPAGKRVVQLKIDSATTAHLFEPIIEAVSQSGGELIHVLEEKKP